MTQTLLQVMNTYKKGDKDKVILEDETKGVIREIKIFEKS